LANIFSREGKVTKSRVAGSIKEMLLIYALDIPEKDVSKSIMDGRNLRRTKVVGVKEVSFNPSRVKKEAFVVIGSTAGEKEFLRIQRLVSRRIEELCVVNEHPKLFEAVPEAISGIGDQVTVDLNHFNLYGGLQRCRFEQDEKIVDYDGVAKIINLINMFDEVDKDRGGATITSNKQIVVPFKKSSHGDWGMAHRQLDVLNVVDSILFLRWEDPDREIKRFKRLRLL
jgi:hypothetical protein